MFIGIDLGTSSVKMILIDQEQKILATSNLALTVQNPKDGYSEQNPQEWINATLECLEILKTKKPKEFSETISIGISGHMHGATLIDNAGSVIRPCILWNDTRSHAECVEFEKQNFDVRSISGNITMPGFTAPKINWLKNNETHNFNKIFKVLLPKDYLRFYLTGEYYSEMSDASGTLWLDTKNRKWSNKLLSCSFLEEKHMPKLVEGNKDTGILKNELKDKFHFNHNVIVVGGAGDNAAAAAGMGITEQKQSFISLGTSGVFFTPTKNFLSNTGDAVHSFCHCLPNKWHLMSVMLSASNCLDWVCSITNTSIQESLTNVERFYSEKSSISNAPFFLPYLSGERTPHNDPHIRGSFHSIKTTTDTTNMQYAVIEGVSFGILDGINSILKVNNNFKDIFMVGGGSRSSFWIELLASLLNRNLSVCDQSEYGAALGVARLAMYADKNIKNKSDIIKEIKISKDYMPNLEKMDVLMKRYLTWKELYSSNKQIASRLII
ncbi:xylulokinase [Pelagibacterales bacterium SAG-MED31]|nr:xylulokinase [Pelagibacterales bacterium SAG-MED31]